MSLKKWFDENWVDIGRPKKGGGYAPCGRKKAGKGPYPKCVPAAKAAKMTAAEKQSAVARKRKAERTQVRVGQKPIRVATKVKKK